MRLFVPAAILLACTLIMAATGSSRADANAAVCAQTYGKSDAIACNYANYEQCRAAVSGLAGSCIDNPYFRAGTKQALPRKRARR